MQPFPKHSQCEKWPSGLQREPTISLMYVVLGIDSRAYGLLGSSSNIEL